MKPVTVPESKLLAIKSRKIKRENQEELPVRELEPSNNTLDPVSGNYSSLASRDTPNRLTQDRSPTGDLRTVGGGGSRRNLFSFIFFKSAKPDENRTTVDFPIQQAVVDKAPPQIKFTGAGLASDVQMRRRKILRLCAGMLVVVAVVLAIGLGVGLSGGSGDDEGELNIAFSCGSESEDQAIRETIADRITSVNASLRAIFLGCLPDDAFGELTEEQLVNIESSSRLVISQTGLSSISPNAFDSLDLSEITSLDLSQNAFKEINVELFDDFPSVQTLDLSSNALTDLDSGVFDGIGSLKELDVSANGFATFPTSLKEISSLETLSFDNCFSLLDIERGYFDGFFPNLGTLSLVETISFLQYGGVQGFRDFSKLDTSVTLIS